MDSQGYGWGAFTRTAWSDGLQVAKCFQRRLIVLRAALIVLLLVWWSPCALAQASNYAYDANGRLVGVTQAGGAARYGYDANGNLLQISSVAPGQLGLFSFVPTHGAAGTQVLIEGQGFSSTPASNAVTFNGTAATVTSASPTQLVASVPSGATTGPISVAVGTQSATSAQPFTVDDTGLPPTISQVSPLVVSVGGVITVTGTHLDPVPGYTVATLGGREVALTASSDTQLQFSVPGSAFSGYVTVQTPYGAATSTALVMTLPVGIDAANVSSTGYAVANGPAVSLNIGASGQIGAMLFSASSDQWISLQASSIATTATSIAYTVYAPGNVVLVQGTVSAASPSIHLPQLKVSGNYLVTFQPTGAGAQLAVGVESDSAYAYDQVANIATTFAGETKRLLVAVPPGQNSTFEVISAATNPSNQSINYTLLAQDGTGYKSVGITGSGVLNLGTVPTALQGSIFQVMISPPASATATVQLAIAPAIQGVLSSNPTNYSAVASGQNIYLTMNAAQGDNLELVVNNLRITNGNAGSVYIYYYDRNGTQISNDSCFTSSSGLSCAKHLWYLPAGTYSFVIVPNGTGQVSLSAFVTRDIVGPNVAVNGAANIALATGQVERLTFNANRGDTVALNVSGIATSPSGQYVTFQVYRPDAGAITTNTAAYTTFNPAGSQTVNLPNLPVSGTYTIIVTPYSGVAASAQFSVVAGSTGSVDTSGDAQSYTANVSGENIYFTFNATQGQNLELTLNNASVIGGSLNQFYVQVINKVGVQIVSFNCQPSNPGASCNQHLWYLPAGTYTVIASPSNGGTIKFNALIEPGVVGPALSAGGSAGIALSAGQVEWLQVSANQGDTVALNLSGVSTTPAGQSVTVLIYRPDVGAITTSTAAYSSFSTSQSQTLNLTNLPVSGNYTLVVIPDSGLAASGLLTVVPGIVGAVTVDGTPQPFTSTSAGQNLYFSFTATQGQNLELDFTNISVKNASYNGFYAYVYNYAGVQVASASCAPPSPASTCQTHLWGMDAGTYTVTVAAYYGGTLSFNAFVRSGRIGPSLANGSAVNVAMNAGDVVWLPLNANQGDAYALSLSGASTTPTGQNIDLAVYRPDGGVVHSNTSTYAEVNTSSSATTFLTNLPATGTYWVVMTTSNGMAATAQVSLSATSKTSPAAGAPTLYANGVPQSATTTQPGAAGKLFFHANYGDNLELVINGMSFTGNASAGAIVSVYDPYGIRIAYYGGCWLGNVGGNCHFSLWNLVPGTYTVTVAPNDANTTMGFNATLLPDVLGPSLTTNSPLPVNLGTDQVERVTFVASAGDTVALNLSGEASTAPTGQPIVVTVYRPDTGAITQSNYYTSVSAFGGATINLQNLPVSGTYTVLLSTPNSTPATGQLTLVPGVVETLTNNGSIQSFAGVGGQNGYASFTARQGDNLELMMSGLKITGSTSVEASMDVYNSKNVHVASDSGCFPSRPGGSCVIHLWNLPADTYRIIITPPSDPNAALQYNLSLTSDIAGSALSANTPATISLGSGQVQRFTFNANLGDTWALSLTGVSTTSPAGQSMSVAVYRPDGGLVTPSSSYANFSATTLSTINLPALPAGGTYTVIASTPYGTAGTGQLTLVPGVTGPVNTNGISQSFSGIAGQNVYASFSANQGDNLELSLNGLTIPGGSGQYVDVNVYNSSGGFVAQSPGCYNSNPAGSCLMPLWNLPADTYSIVIVPSTLSPVPYSLNLQLQPDLSGGALVPNNPVSVGLGTGQIERFTFNANLGDSFTLNLAGASTSPAGRVVHATVYRPDTGLIIGSSAWATVNATSTNSVSLTNLPASGTYTVVVYTDFGLPGSAQLSLVPQ